LRLIGEFMPARMGGSAEQRAEANATIWPDMWRDLQKRMAEFRSHEEYQRRLATDWMRAMCARIGVTAPSDDDAVRLYNELSSYVAQRANAAISGAADAVRDLHRAGYTLYTASGTTSWELRG